MFQLIQRIMGSCLLLAAGLSAAAYTDYPTTDASYTQTKASDHFQLFWKNVTDYTMTTAGADSILAGLEAVWDFHVAKNGFPYWPNKSKSYKGHIYIVTDGWASAGGLANGPGMWLARGAASDFWALAHEYTHGLQIGTGGFNNSASGAKNDFGMWFFESHANWMANQMHPDVAHCSEMYTRQQELYSGSSRNRYCNWQLSEYLKDYSGSAEIINNLWLTWPGEGATGHRDEDYFRALMRTQNWTISQLNDVYGTFALHMAFGDFKNGSVFRKAWYTDQTAEWKLKQWIHPNVLDSAKRRYAVPFYLAPQRYAQNVIRLYPDANSDSLQVEFRGITQAAPAVAWSAPKNIYEPDSFSAPGSEWRWGMVAVNPTGNSGQPSYRYIGPFAGTTSVATLKTVAGETQFYLVVAATPNKRQLISFDEMYYDIYRYPYMFQVAGGQPEGFQANAWPVPTGGSRHANGGGYVASGATVAATAYVALNARVLDNSKVQDNARIEGNATIKGGSVVKENAVVKDRANVWGGATIGGTAVVQDDAIVIGSSVSGSAVIKDFAAAINSATISGSAVLGGVSIIWDPGANISGTTQILGDAEIRGITASKGVFYGFVDNETVADATLGANRTAPVPEVTAKPTYTWVESPTNSVILPTTPAQVQVSQKIISGLALESLASPVTGIVTIHTLNGKLILTQNVRIGQKIGSTHLVDGLAMYVVRFE